MEPLKEATKDTSRVGVFAALSVVISFYANKYLNAPPEVVAAIVLLVTVGVDSAIHHSRMKLNGLLPF